jgi:hypothetical protein
MQKNGRFGAEPDANYRYKHQGQESDSEILGEGNSYAYEYRMSDARLGRFWRVDPLSAQYPYWTPYAFSGNMIIQFVELEGLEPVMRGNAGVYLGMRASGYSDDEAQKYIESMRKGDQIASDMVGDATVLGTAIAIDFFVTKGWLTRMYAVYHLGNAYDYNSKAERARDAGNIEDYKSYSAMAGNEIEMSGVIFLAPIGIASKLSFLKRIVTLPVVEVISKKVPTTYLNEALKRQALKSTPKKLKESWDADGYKYEVRLKPSNSKYGRSGTEMRVSRQKKGSGLEYMDEDGNWHHESTLKSGKKGNVNPNFNEEAAKKTHIELD